MIKDLTKISIHSLGKEYRIGRYLTFRPDLYYDDRFYQNAVYDLFLTGGKKEREQKRKFKYDQQYRCVCCGRFYVHRAWNKYEGFCYSCYKKDMANRSLTLYSPDRTHRIRDLINRCY